MRILPALHTDEFYISLELIKNLLTTQIPSLSAQALCPIVPGGTDHVMIRIGDLLVGRFPRHPGAVAAGEVEKKWLPLVNARLSVNIPKIVHVGHPSDRYPAPWSVLTWLPGTTATPPSTKSSTQVRSGLAEDLAKLFNEVRAVERPPGLRPSEVPQHYRTSLLSERNTYLTDALNQCDDVFDKDAVVSAWKLDMLNANPYLGPPVAAHGDLQPSNIIIDPDIGRLTGIIDWSGLSFGDPAVDLLPAWMLLDKESRKIFRKCCQVDDNMWQRGRAWALSIGIIAYPYYRHSRPDHAAVSKRQVEEVLADVDAEP